MSDKNIADVANKAIDKIEQLAQAMASRAPEGWDLLVRAERLSGWIDLATALVCAIVAIFAFRFAKKVLSEDEEGSYRSDSTIFAGGALYVLAAIMLIPVLLNARSGFFSVSCPEHYAATKVLQLVH
jgi:hypothetical protein